MESDLTCAWLATVNNPSDGSFAPFAPSVKQKQPIDESSHNNITSPNPDVIGLRLKGHLCSDIYRQVMCDLQTASGSAIVDTPLIHDETTGTFDSLISMEESCTSPTNLVPIAGRRAWKLYVYVAEQHVRQRNSETAMNLRFMRSMIDILPRAANTRNELYQRYLERPDDWLCGLVNCPEYLLQRRKQSQCLRMKLSKHSYENRRVDI